MSCQFYNNNGNSCAGCISFVKSISIELDGEFLVVTIPEMQFKNHQKICLCLAQAIPEGITADTKVIVHIGTADLAKLQIITRRGNFLYADVVKSRKVYPLFAATDTEALVLYDMCKIGATGHTFSNIPEVFPPEK